MKLQNVIYPNTQQCTEEKMYFHRDLKTRYSFANNEIELYSGGYISFDTYFNSISANKWFKYTEVKDILLSIKLKGKFRISLLYKEKNFTKVQSKVVGEYCYDTNGEIETVTYKFETEFTQGMYAFALLCLNKKGIFYDAYYHIDIDKSKIHDVKIANVICTFKREKYVYKNVKVLTERFLENKNSELHNKLELFVIDNANTINENEFNSEKIHLFNNKNVGGAGGFTRGMIEVVEKENNDITHILLTDDDIVVEPESFYRTYAILALLKDEYKEAFIGGAMFRLDYQYFQTESGAIWNDGALISRKSGLDLRETEACLYNEYEETCDYTAWWYCAFPKTIIKEDNYPLPIFIRGDDAEYGIRNMKKNLILMNGICVWHEPFENKYSSSMYYYIFRNRLINNAIHNKKYAKRKFLKEFTNQYMRELFSYRYKNADLLLKGVEDYLKGLGWLKQQDGELLNKKILESGYKLENIENSQFPFSYRLYEKTCNYTETKKIQRKRRLLLNGLFLRATSYAIVPTVDPPIASFYRIKEFLNYDIATKKGFTTSKDYGEIFRCIKQYLVLRAKVNARYAKVNEEYIFNENMR